MDTVTVRGDIFRGTHYGSVGVYTHAYGYTYAGAHEGGKAHGEGVYTWSDGRTCSGQFANGQRHGHFEHHWADGDVYYELRERGNQVHYALVRPDGACCYDREPCGADHADFAKLKTAAQQAGVRTCPLPASNAMPAPFGRTATHAPFRFSHCAGFWCLASARGFWRACASVRVCMCACVCVRVFVRARSCVRGCV